MKVDMGSREGGREMRHFSTHKRITRLNNERIPGVPIAAVSHTMIQSSPPPVATLLVPLIHSTLEIPLT